MNDATFDGALLVIGNPELRATFAPELGMLGTSLRRHDAEYLALPGGVSGYRDGHQAGLPLLAPWANRLSRDDYRAAGVDVDLHGLELRRDGNGLPIHGTMTAARGWEVVERVPARVSARFDYAARPDLLRAFPYPHEITIDAAIEERTLTVTTTVTPTSARDVPVSFGWHPYLRLPRGDRAAWILRMPARDHREIDSAGIPTGRSGTEPASADPIGVRTFDDLYGLGDAPVFVLEYERSRLDVRFESGYRFGQVYAPPHTDFVCIEPMTAPTDALVRGDAPVVAPNDSFSARFSITVA
jgi:aldose 1-epimerase